VGFSTKVNAGVLQMFYSKTL